VDIRG
jgi:hypothetical protein